MFAVHALIARAGVWLDALWPRVCAGCAARVERECAFCGECEGRLRTIPRDACAHCQLHPTTRSGICATRPASDPLEAALAGVWLSDPVTHWIHAFKYPAPGLRGLAPGPAAAACELALRSARRAGAPPGRVVPVPLHSRRLRERGFNPALTLARAVARGVGARCDPIALERIRDTPSQTGLDLPARRRNVAGCMRARGAAPSAVWLVDDVLTTGATAREAAGALRRAGARRVVLIAAARTPLDRE